MNPNGTLCAALVLFAGVVHAQQEDPARWTAAERDEIHRVIGKTTIESVKTREDYRAFLRKSGSPVMTYQGWPIYPPEQVRKQVQGCVLVEFTIRPDGKTDDFEILRSEPPGLFDALALRAVYATEFEPIETAKRYRFPVTLFLGQPVMRELSLLNSLKDAKRRKVQAELVKRCGVEFFDRAMQAP